jgi:hypothetical protein
VARQKLFDTKEVSVAKKTDPWKNDTTLHNCLGKKVTVHGSMVGSQISYDSITLLEQQSLSPSVLEGRADGINIEKALEDALKKAPPPPGPDMIQKFIVNTIRIETIDITVKTTCIVEVQKNSR